MSAGIISRDEAITVATTLQGCTAAEAAQDVSVLSCRELVLVRVAVGVAERKESA